MNIIDIKIIPENYEKHHFHKNSDPKSQNYRNYTPKHNSHKNYVKKYSIKSKSTTPS